MLVDTDVLIWYMRGNRKAYDLIEDSDEFYISVITYIELLQGIRNKRELLELKKAIRNWDCKIIQINREISSKAMFYIERHYLSNSLQIADALIAATALTNGFALITGNGKHFKIIKQLEIKVFRP